MNILPQTKTSGIYKIENTVNGKCYVGSAVNIGKRWSVHFNGLNNNKHHSRYLQSAWNKYGKDCFAFSVLEIVPDILMLTSVEQYFIDTLCPEYNICPKAGSPLGVIRSAETRAKLSAAGMGNKNTLGYKHSPAARANMSLADTGRKHTPEQDAKMMGNQNALGHKHSAETIAKMTGRKLSAESIAKRSASFFKPVLQFTLNMEFVAEYKSGIDAQAATGVDTCNISTCCNGNRKSSGGYIWKHKPKVENERGEK